MTDGYGSLQTGGLDFRDGTPYIGKMRQSSVSFGCIMCGLHGVILR